MKILLIEDDLNLSNDLSHQLRLKEFNVDTAFDSDAAEKHLEQSEYDCILLDVNIPGKNGYELARHIRSKNINTPIIMLTAYGEIDDKLTGFESGADDYITKPFYFQELIARIRVFVKRSEPQSVGNTMKIEDMTIDLNKKQVFRNDILIKLTAREFEIIKILAAENGNPISKKELLSKVWGTTFEANSNTIEVFINMLRNKIDKDFSPKLIKTRIGYGYYLGVE